MCKWLSYKKNRTKYVRVTCFAIGVAILLGLFCDGLYPVGDGLNPETGWMSDEDPVGELRTYLSHTISEMQAEPGQIGSDNFEICEAADRNDSDREESLRMLVYIFDFFVVGILLLLKRITTNTYRMQCHGNASIICYIHHKDGQK